MAADPASPETAQPDAKRVVMRDLKPEPVGTMPIVAAGFASLQSFELIQRVAKMFAQSTVVPDNFRGNIGNCAIALEMASRIGASPLMVMQNLDVIYGRPSWRAVFLIGCFNQCGRFDAITYEWGGEKGKDTWSCRAISKNLQTGQKIRGPEITIALSKAEGWYERKGSKWKTIPELMLMYRAAAWMIKTTAPEISLGLQDTDELGDTFNAQRTGDGRYEVPLESLRRHATPEPEPKAIPDQKDAITAIKATKTLAELEAVYGPIVQAFVDNNENVPLPVEAAYTDHKAGLEQLV